MEYNHVAVLVVIVATVTTQYIVADGLVLRTNAVDVRTVDDIDDLRQELAGTKTTEGGRSDLKSALLSDIFDGRIDVEDLRQELARARTTEGGDLDPRSEFFRDIIDGLCGVEDVRQNLARTRTLEGGSYGYDLIPELARSRLRGGIPPKGRF